MVNMSLPILPNCKRTFSCCSAVTFWEGSTAATSWKFLTEATVTRPLKFRHQHCSCSCHLGALFFNIRGSLFPEIDSNE
uniref:Tubby-like F-box protein n=1 Tax=Rhizophora mucronata TaxID=61149 RepID=A0A2P2JYW1_RHIMU